MSAYALAQHDAYSNARDELYDIVRTESFRTGETYLLASGRESNLFFDMKKTMCDPRGINLIADLILDRIADEDVRFVGGLELGAVPIVIALCLKSEGNRNLRSFIVRKERKDHGTQKLVDGHLESGSSVILFDDVTTTGGSVLNAVQAVRERGCRVTKVVTIVDREEGASEALAKHGIELIHLFCRRDFVQQEA